jgi:hypothetical protein
MNGIQTAKRHTDIGTALRGVEQLGGELDYSNTKLQPQNQGLPPHNPNLFDALTQFIAGCQS